MSNDTPRKGGKEEYSDPLENYDPKVYDDPLEQALAEEPVASIQTTPYVTVPPQTPVAQALQKLVDLRVGCLLVEEDQKLVGIFTERDALNKVALEFDEVKDKSIREFMTSNLIYVYNTDSSAAALSVMAATGYRHVPVVDLDECLVGVIGPRRVTTFLQTHLGVRPSGDQSFQGPSD